MKIFLYPLPFLLIILIFLIRAEILKIKKQIYFLKPVCTSLVIATVLLTFKGSNDHFYSAGILIGLIFSLCGDVSLMFMDRKKPFLIGLILFILAHIVYIIVFSALSSVSYLDIISTAVLLLIGFLIFKIFSPNLGKMKIPVIFYILIISVMVNRAFSVLISSKVEHIKGIMIFIGAILFYISDVMLASARFWRTWKYHRISLAFYYSGQFLIAASAGLF